MFITTTIFLLRFMHIQAAEAEFAPDPLMELAATHAPVPVLVTTETADLQLEAMMLQTIPPRVPFVVVHQPTRPPQARDAELPDVVQKAALTASAGHGVRYEVKP